MGKYKRTSQRHSYSKEDLKTALTLILQHGEIIRDVGRRYKIPESSLRRHIKIRNHIREKKSTSLGRAPIFTPEEEKELADHALRLAKMFFGLTSKELRTLAFKFAEEKKIKHSFNRVTEMAGKDWFHSFMTRNSKISLRKPEATSVNRVSAFNKKDVDLFFKNLVEIQERFRIPPDRIYNVDETGISTVPKEKYKRIGPTGIKQFGILSSAERGRNITVICAMSASGTFVPPLFVFPRVRMNPQLEKNGPNGAVYCCSKNGWSNEGIFFQWLKHFQSKTNSDPENRVLLILDNHNSHISYEIYNFCRDKGILMLSLPPHTSHKLQPLDLTFFGPFKSSYSYQCTLFLKNKMLDKNSEEYKITEYDIAEIFNLAYSQVANIDKALSGFRSAGIYPLNPEKFSLEDFAPANQIENYSVSDNEENVDIHQNSSQPSTSGFLQVSSWYWYYGLVIY